MFPVLFLFIMALINKGRMNEKSSTMHMWHDEFDTCVDEYMQMPEDVYNEWHTANTYANLQFTLALFCVIIACAFTAVVTFAFCKSR